jgi:hypothetical protein
MTFGAPCPVRTRRARAQGDRTAIAGQYKLLIIDGTAAAAGSWTNIQAKLNRNPRSQQSIPPSF